VEHIASRLLAACSTRPRQPAGAARRDDRTARSTAPIGTDPAPRTGHANTNELPFGLFRSTFHIFFEIGPKSP